MTTTLADAPKIYKEPVVTLLSSPRFWAPEHMPVNFQGVSEEAEQLAEFAGRLCYMSQHNPAGRTTQEYLTNILELAHGSVLEHVNFSLLVEGVSRSLTHELIRHRAGMAYSQVSQRYVDESDTAFVMPPAVQDLSEELQVYWLWDVLSARNRYAALAAQLMREMEANEPDPTMRRKRAREAARSLLPNATETKIVVTGNVRAWRHVITMRGHVSADREIQQFARAVHKVLVDEAPHLFGDFHTDEEGSLVPQYQKV